jgi:hypothetical protein
MGRTWQADPKAWDDLLGSTRSLSVGATQPYPNVFPHGLGIGKRGQPRNEYLGLVMTRPQPNIFILGVNYFDTVDDGDNEDMYKVDVNTFQITPYMRATFEKEYPQYAGHHWAAKPYLRKLPNV